jgi:hypothetical protein
MTDELDLPALFDQELVPLDDAQRLYLSSAIIDWAPIHAAGITVVVDLEGGLDQGVSTQPGHMLYVYFHIYDEALPPLDRLHAIAELCARLVASGNKVLVHCQMGLNRSALLAGMVLRHFGLPGAAVVERLRARRPGALYNDVFADYLASLPAARPVEIPPPLPAPPDAASPRA